MQVLEISKMVCKKLVPFAELLWKQHRSLKNNKCKELSNYPVFPVPTVFHGNQLKKFSSL